MNVSLELTNETAEKVSRAASRAGRDVPAFLADFVRQSFSGVVAPRRTVAEILAPFRAEVERSGINDRQLDTLFTAAREQAFAGRRPPRE
jgi:hypothetical protein